MASFLEITKLKVRSLDLDIQEISWELAPTHVDVLDFTFQLLRSESPEGPFDPLGAPFEDRYIAIDTELQQSSRWRRLYYKIRCTHKRTSESRDSDAVALEAEPDLYAMEARRNFQLMMAEFAGRRCWAFLKRTFGQRCSCWSPVLMKQTRSGCQTCYDTTYVRGYFSPIETWMQIDPSPKTDQVTNVGVMQQSNTTARLAYYPSLKPGDLIVEPENRRWRVMTVNATEKARATLHQEIVLHEIPQRDIEFNLPLNPDMALRDLWLSPARNHNNPQNLDAFEDEIFPNILAIYGGGT